MSKFFIGIDVLSHPRLSFHVVDPTLAELRGEVQEFITGEQDETVKVTQTLVLGVSASLQYIS